MQRFLLISAVLWAGQAVLAVEPPVTPLAGVTLSQCYEWARQQNENLKIFGQDIEQSKARSRAALSGALPDLRWKLTDTWQEPEGVDELERRGFSGFVEKEQVESKFSVEQTLFSGLREFSAWSGFRRETARDQLLYDREARKLFEQTANAFYLVVAREAERENTAATLASAEDRVTELRDFRRLGKARDSEVFTAQAHAAARKSELGIINARIQAAREDLSYLTGQDLSNTPIADEIPTPPSFDSLEEALRLSQQRTDLRAQNEDVEARRLRIRYERGFYWPTADITGNYYTKRATFLEAIDWDVIFTLDVPLFQGGAVRARVLEAKADYQQSILTLGRMEREVASSIRKTHRLLAAAVQETIGLQEAVQAAQKSYDALRQEYKYGLVTNLDVLQALELLQDQKSAYDAARVRSKQLYVELNVATEKLP
jgi:outer membrane protein